MGAHAVGSTRVNAIAPVRMGQVQKPCREMSRRSTTPTDRKAAAGPFMRRPARSTSTIVHVEPGTSRQLEGGGRAEASCVRFRIISCVSEHAS